MFRSQFRQCPSRRAIRVRRLSVFPALAMAGSLFAQDHTLLFNVSDAGVSKAITNWGFDVTWPSEANTRRSIAFMTANEVDMVRVGFLADAPLTNGQLSAAQKADLSYMAWLANLAGANKPWTMSHATGAGVDAWFKMNNGANVIPGRWVEAMVAAKRHYGRTLLSTEPFNEPDYGWNQGTVGDLFDIMGLLQADTNFTGVRLAGGSVLNVDNANWWYDQIKSRATEGTTHTLGGTFNNYVSFIQNVIASGDVPFNPEVHNLAEVIIGAEYGLHGGIWWGPAELARGSFIKGCQGVRLAYAEDRPKWTAAAVYRGTNGAVQAFAGSSERMGETTSYRFFSKDRDVFFDGEGPRRDYTVNVSNHHERVVNITWGADVAPAINGRYIIANRLSGKVMEVAAASAQDGANIRQNTYTNGVNQQWDVVPFSSPWVDQSYYTIRAAHSGKAADVNNWGLNGGANVMQWSAAGGENQTWFLEYTGNGYFKIRSRWSGHCLDVEGASTANGANIFQWIANSQFNQQWRLIPAGAPVEFTPPPVVTGVTAVANPLSVRLNWNASAAADLGSYTVLRGLNAAGPYEIVARGLTNNSFTDKSANQNRTYFYVVRAVDRSLNSSANSAPADATPDCSRALLARYSFEDTLNDTSPNANHPIVVNGTPGMVAGKYGSALDLNGTGDYAMLPANLFASVTNFTVALWVNWDGGGSWQRVFDFGNGTTQYLFLTPSSGGGTLRFAISTNGYSAEQTLEAPALPVGQWRHVAITRNANAAKLYTNGVVAASGTMSISPAAIDAALNFLGESQYASDPLFNGRIDELFLYNYALSEVEIARLMGNVSPPPGTPTSLAAAWNGSTLSLSWPIDYLGCRLQVQTNAPDAGLSTNWVDVAGSNFTNRLDLSVGSAGGSVFYRLVYP